MARRKTAPGEWVDTWTKEDWTNRAAWSRELARQAELRETGRNKHRRQAGEKQED